MYLFPIISLKKFLNAGLTGQRGHWHEKAFNLKYPKAFLQALSVFPHSVYESLRATQMPAPGSIISANVTGEKWYLISFTLIVNLLVFPPSSELSVS